MSRTNRKKPVRPADELAKVLQELNINVWHYLLIGDGSGSTINRSIGWSCLLLEHSSHKSWVFEGGFNTGTNNLAELMAYVQTVAWLCEYNRDSDCGFSEVHVLTDSDWVAKSGSGSWGGRSHQALWQSLKFASRLGIRLHFHWVERDRLFGNRVSHHLANFARLALDHKQHDTRVQRAKQKAGGTADCRMVHWKSLTAKARKPDDLRQN